MKFLIDRCAGRQLAQWLIDHGHDVIHVGDLGPDPGDEILLQTATTMGRILVTIDTDFGTLIFRDSMAHRGVVRLPDVPASERINIMAQLLAKHASDLEAGAIITVRGTRVRITPGGKPAPGAPGEKGSS